MNPDDPKRRAAERAVGFIEPGMTVGIGTGSTADHFIDLLAQRVAGGLDITGVPSSERSRQRAEALGIRLSSLDEHPSLDLTVDGADEIDPEMRLIKGGGGALLREKIVACASRSLLVIADESKLVGHLGAFPLPIEVVPFGLAATRASVERTAAACGCGGEIALRGGAAHPFVTDGGHYILDCRFGLIPDPLKLATRLDGLVGVVEHGLFIDLAAACIIAGADGVRILGDPRRL